mmetsp:Transcript_41121/g.116999  ORF Transcript_41121/g.116999 Transcript_41121/m.116999 type:complete len:236 (-) Transcript_41121:171-878(-)
MAVGGWGRLWRVDQKTRTNKLDHTVDQTTPEEQLGQPVEHLRVVKVPLLGMRGIGRHIRTNIVRIHIPRLYRPQHESTQPHAGQNDPAGQAPPLGHPPEGACKWAWEGDAVGEAELDAVSEEKQGVRPHCPCRQQDATRHEEAAQQRTPSWSDCLLQFAAERNHQTAPNHGRSGDPCGVFVSDGDVALVPHVGGDVQIEVAEGVHATHRQVEDQTPRKHSDCFPPRRFALALRPG